MRKGNSYSNDLRARVVAAIEKGGTIGGVALQFSVGSATVYRWVRLHRETGSYVPRPYGGGRRRSLDEVAHQIIWSLVEEKPDRTIAELTELIRERGYKTSNSSVSRALLRLGLTFKKKLSLPANATALTL
jgi:transposase